jgi:hypothetical protein
MKKLVVVLMLLILASCTRTSRTAVDRWANDMRQIDRTEDVNNRMASYDYFYEMYEQIRAYTLQYELEKDEDIKVGIRNILNRQISAYNANSQKYYRSQWKGQGLPDKIDLVK